MGLHVGVGTHHRHQLYNFASETANTFFKLNTLYFEFPRDLFTFKNRATHVFIMKHIYFRNVYLVSTLIVVFFFGGGGWGAS